MCIVGLAQSLHPHFPFVLVDNRDEDPNRSTGSIDIRRDETTGFQILSAIDAREGGTWMGYNLTTHNLVVLTNVFGPIQKPHKLVSRGVLVNSILMCPDKLKTMQHVMKIKHVLQPYFENGQSMRGFNVICGNLEGTGEKAMFYMTNRDENAEEIELTVRELERDEIHIVSNSFLNDTKNQLYHNYKLNLLRRLLKDTLTSDACRNITNSDELVIHLERCITNRLTDYYEGGKIVQSLKQVDSLDYHQDTSLVDLLPKIWTNEVQVDDHFRLLFDSHYNIFVNRNHFKTRSQTIIMVDRSGKVHYFYRDVDKLFLKEPSNMEPNDTGSDTKPKQNPDLRQGERDEFNSKFTWTAFHC